MYDSRIIAVSAIDSLQKLRLIVMVKQVFKKKVIGTFYLPGFITQYRVKAIGPLYIFGVDVKLPDACIDMSII